MRIQPFNRFCAIAASAVLISSLTVQPSIEQHSDLQLSIGSEASAKSSGGRSGGGSFKSSPSRSSGSSSSPSRPNNSPSYNNNPGYNNGGYNNGPVIIPVPIGGGGYNSGPGYNNGQPTQTASRPASTWDLVLGFIILGAGATIVIFVTYLIIKSISSAVRGGGVSKKDRELNNDIVTVSRIQVGLLAQARSIQSELTQLSLEVDTDTPEGLQQLLQESALALLRTPENWSHVLADSQAVKSRSQAETVFSKLSVNERTKFNVESLVNVGGRITQRDLKIDPEEDPASYIVVTLLVGTAHDKPLFTEIRTEEALKQALEQLASLPAEYLMTFELLWSPQDQSDSLTYDELLMEYTEMVQI